MPGAMYGLGWSLIGMETMNIVDWKQLLWDLAGRQPLPFGRLQWLYTEAI